MALSTADIIGITVVSIALGAVTVIVCLRCCNSMAALAEESNNASKAKRAKMLARSISNNVRSSFRRVRDSFRSRGGKRRVTPRERVPTVSDKVKVTDSDLHPSYLKGKEAMDPVQQENGQNGRHAPPDPTSHTSGYQPSPKPDIPDYDKPLANRDLPERSLASPPTRNAAPTGRRPPPTRPPPPPPPPPPPSYWSHYKNHPGNTPGELGNNTGPMPEQLDDSNITQYQHYPSTAPGRGSTQPHRQTNVHQANQPANRTGQLKTVAPPTVPRGAHAQNRPVSGDTRDMYPVDDMNNRNDVSEPRMSEDILNRSYEDTGFPRSAQPVNAGHGPEEERHPLNLGYSGGQEPDSSFHEYSDSLGRNIPEESAMPVLQGDGVKRDQMESSLYPPEDGENYRHNRTDYLFERGPYEPAPGLTPDRDWETPRWQERPVPFAAYEGRSPPRDPYWNQGRPQWPDTHRGHGWPSQAPDFYQPHPAAGFPRHPYRPVQHYPPAPYGHFLPREEGRIRGSGDVRGYYGPARRREEGRPHYRDPSLQGPGRREKHAPYREHRPLRPMQPRAITQPGDSYRDMSMGQSRPYHKAETTPYQPHTSQPHAGDTYV